MNETPRLRSAFPATPRTEARPRQTNSSKPTYPTTASTSAASPPTRPVQNIQPSQKSKDGPLISYDTVDAPTQRFYVAAIFVALWSWRLLNAFNVTNELDSTWLFLKWLAIDATFLVALPAFRIEWLEYSFATTIAIWLLHAVANAFLMYHITPPIFAWLGALGKIAYDRELAISEHRVKPADIYRNSSIILGKQIIQILPEGSAILNPEKHHFCLDSLRKSIELPIQINQTTPISLELIRYELDSDEQESLVINAKQAKRLKADADKSHSKSDTTTPRTLHYTVSKQGIYRLMRVVDETKLEVRKRSHDVAVVACPQATVSVGQQDKCTGDLSGVSLNLVGVPPFKVKYSKRINSQRSSSITQSVQPPDLDVEDTGTGTPDAVMNLNTFDKSWTGKRSVSFEINESLDKNGTWSYHVEEVEDGLGNKVQFSDDQVKRGPDEHSGRLSVHRRPVVSLTGCDAQKILRAPQGKTVELPVDLRPKNQMPASDWPLKLKYTFSGQTDEEVAPTETLYFDIANERSKPRITRPGRYSVDAVDSQFCRGAVTEPSSCVLSNPAPPDIFVEHEEVFDKCAGRPIGVLVNLDLVGTPPFKVRYTKTYNGMAETHTEHFNSMRGQMMFQERDAGQYIYHILEVTDPVYGAVSLVNRNLVVTQDIKPAAGALFRSGAKLTRACLDQPVSLPVGLEGEGPWTLEYEIMHNGKRKKHSVRSEHPILNIEIPGQTDGGKYTVVLTGVEDKSRCRSQLSDERDIEIRAERPSASFGDLDGSRMVTTLMNKPVEMPLRLRGIGPWTVRLQNVDSGSGPQTHTFHHANAVIKEKTKGTFELLSVHDSCPGTVDPATSRFVVAWVDRPCLAVTDKSVESIGTNVYRKAAVCQGYEDSLSLELSGSPGFELTYQQKAEPVKGPLSTTTKAVSSRSGKVVIKLESSRAGEYSYLFSELADGSYENNKGHFRPVNVKHQVYALPTAKFAQPGKTYAFCKDDAANSSDQENEQVPVTLTGVPPFSIEVAITHHGATRRPEVKRITDIGSNSYSLSLARSSFELGSHTLLIRSVKDSRGCESIFDTDPSSIRVHVTSPPTITALQSQADFCVGDHVSFSLSGQAPFDVFYTFQNRERKARVATPEFKRIAETPGEMVITGVSDAAMGKGTCKARKDIRKIIHPYPSVRISKGQTQVDDIHEGGEVDIRFDFTGTPPFEFTYTRSENVNPRSKSKKKPVVLETRHGTSEEFFKVIRATEEGTYEVISIRDRHCAYSAAAGAKIDRSGNARIGWGEKKLLQN